MKHFTKKQIGYMIFIAGIILLNLVAWNSKSFSDAYLLWIFPIWVNTYGRLTGLAPFSVGEWLIIAGLVLLVLALFFLPGAVIMLFRKKKEGRFYRLAKGFYSFLGNVFLIVALIMTLNCFILYHGSTFGEMYFPDEKEKYSVEELVQVWNLVVQNCNTLSKEMERDEKGYVLYPEGETAMQQTARQAMIRLGDTYPRLSGFYPCPKRMYFSDFMCQQYMCGYYFPFSMEANYNGVMYITNKPETMCHELAHLKGYIQEDEANFISFLACTNSENVFFQYGGYLGVLGYLSNELADLNEEDLQRISDQGISILGVEKQVAKDYVFVLQEEWERIEEEAVVSTEIVDKAAETFVETSLKLNGVSDGMKRYGRVVQLLLAYYEENGFIGN